MSCTHVAGPGSGHRITDFMGPLAPRRLPLFRRSVCKGFLVFVCKGKGVRGLGAVWSKHRLCVCVPTDGIATHADIQSGYTRGVKHMATLHPSPPHPPLQAMNNDIMLVPFRPNLGPFACLSRSSNASCSPDLRRQLLHAKGWCTSCQ